MNMNLLYKNILNRPLKNNDYSFYKVAFQRRYYGARYQDPKTSRWLSTDPALSSYLPTAGGDNSQLPGMGGIFNTVNLHLYHYSFNNPINYVDPNGRSGQQDGAEITPPPDNALANSLLESDPPAEPLPEGTVFSERGGVVFRAGWQNPDDHSEGMGWRISIDTEDGHYDQYGHLDPESTPPVGTRVGQDEPIGIMADPSNGETTGPHVHVERRNNDGTTDDPALTLPPFCRRK